MNQYYKSVSYPRALNRKNKTRILKLAFNKNDKEFTSFIHSLNSSQIRALLDFRTYEDIEKQAADENRSLNNICLITLKKNLKKNNIKSKETLFHYLNNKKFNISKNSATFKNNKNHGLYNWYPYIEGFSYDFVEEILKTVVIEPKYVYDPFGGTGTTILVSSINNINSAFSEINPFMRFLIEAKITALMNYKETIKPKIETINRFLKNLKKIKLDDYKLKKFEIKLQEKGYFIHETLIQLSYLKNRINTLKQSKIIKDLLKIALSSIIVQESNMIRRSDLRYKRSNEYNEFYQDAISLFRTKAFNIFNELEKHEDETIAPTACVSENSMNIDCSYNNRFDLIITSPPYANGTNYFRNTKLELLFLEFIENEDALKKLRTEAITAGINNVSKRNKKPEELGYVAPIVKKLELDKYDSRIPRLVECYFSDMKIVFQKMHNVLSENGDFFIDIGDSKFKNVHVPSDRIFEKIADEIGFELIEKMKFAIDSPKTDHCLVNIFCTSKKELNILEKENHLIPI